jgi:hypothetical protein
MVQNDGGWRVRNLSNISCNAAVFSRKRINNSLNRYYSRKRKYHTTCAASIQQVVVERYRRYKDSSPHDRRVGRPTRNVSKDCSTGLFAQVDLYVEVYRLDGHYNTACSIDVNNYVYLPVHFLPSANRTGIDSKF